METELFKRHHINFDKLCEYGFIKEKDNYVYSKNIVNNSFMVIITVDFNGELKGKIIDTDTQEEYIKVHLNNIGIYTSKVKEEYENILRDIREKCYHKDYFISNQANRITKYINDNYGDKPEFLWSKYPGFGIFRNKKNKKWYALIANVKAGKLDNRLKEVEIINLKISNIDLVDLLKKNGIYRAYHMNKKEWVSIVLNDTLTDDEIKTMIDQSWLLIDKKNN